jgi:hypothetical protein
MPPDVKVIVYVVFAVSGLAGVTETSVSVPFHTGFTILTGVPPEEVTVVSVALKELIFIASLKVTVIIGLKDTPVAELNGDIAVTVGAAVDEPPPEPEPPELLLPPPPPHPDRAAAAENKNKAITNKLKKLKRLNGGIFIIFPPYFYLKLR